MKTDTPMITVIIPMYNAKKYIEQAIDSVLNQTFKDVGVLVIDDCSTDDSYELVQSRYGDNERVTLMRNRKNVGPLQTRNLGFRLATSKYIAMLDNDDVFLPNALEVFFNIAETQKADVVSSFGTLHSMGENIPKDFSGQFIPEIFGSPIRDATVLGGG
ncbi:MAG: glycosyltransferase family 2 protein, partial [Selenomonadaceae bacterium]|nr:glycosyltransferase family 2 protein [Selenomonadaceae bacterium]